MAAASDYAENLQLTWILTNNTATRPSARYIALYTAAPSDTGGGTEVAGGSYARQVVTFSVTGNTASNSGTITFPTATASWGTVNWVGIFDAVTGGNLLYWGQTTTGKIINTGDTFQINNNNLIITLD